MQHKPYENLKNNFFFVQFVNFRSQMTLHFENLAGFLLTTICGVVNFQMKCIFLTLKSYSFVRASKIDIHLGKLLYYLKVTQKNTTLDFYDEHV